MDLLFKLVATMGNSEIKRWRGQLQDVKAKLPMKCWNLSLVDLVMSLKGEVTIMTHVYIEKIETLEYARSDLVLRSLYSSD